MKLKFSGQIFEKNKKNLNINFLQNTSSVSRVVPCGRTDKHEANNLFFFKFYLGETKSRFLNFGEVPF
jgi:hypothetical protein